MKFVITLAIVQYTGLRVVQIDLRMYRLVERFWVQEDVTKIYTCVFDA